MYNHSARFAGIFAVTLVVTAGVLAAPPEPKSAQIKVAPSASSSRNTVLSAPNPAMRRAAPPVRIKLPANIVAQVNGTNITREDAIGLFDMLHGMPVVGELIKDKIVSDEARRVGVSVSETELTKAIQSFKDAVVANQLQRGQPTTYEAFAALQGLTPEIVRWTVYRQTLQHDTYSKAVEAQIPPITNQIKVAHLLIATIPLGGAAEPKAPTAAEQAAKDAAAKTKIDGILADIKAGKITFENAASINSDDTSNKTQGGVLPFAPHQTFDPAFEEAAWSIKKKGEVIGPVKSKFGWHLIKLITRGSEATPAEKTAYHAEQMTLVNQQLANPDGQKAWLNDLVTRAHVVVNPSPSIVSNPKFPASAGAMTAAPKKTAAK